MSEKYEISKANKALQIKPSESDINRFNAFIAKDEITNCWNWTGGKNTDGYGCFWFNNTTVRASRFSYVFNIGEIPSGLLICHKCDNPGCVNPDHLFSENQQVNVTDAILKGRRNHSIHPSVDYYRRFHCRCKDCTKLNTIACAKARMVAREKKLQTKK